MIPVAGFQPAGNRKLYTRAIARSKSVGGRSVLRPYGGSLAKRVELSGGKSRTAHGVSPGVRRAGEGDVDKTFEVARRARSGRALR